MPRTPAPAIAACALLLGAAAAPLPAFANVPAGVYTYRVDHPTYGEIGTFSNTIRHEAGDTTTVDSRMDIAVRVVSVLAHRLEAERKEVWSNGRLVSYSGVTVENDETTRIEGRAQGDRFVIEGPQGRVEAPADVVPTNPWSTEMLDAPVVMATQSGRLFEANVSGGEEEMTQAAGGPIPIRRFTVVADSEYELWYDQNNVLLRFTTENDGTPIVFTLK